jgi:hypothetical protein
VWNDETQAEEDTRSRLQAASRQTMHHRRGGDGHSGGKHSHNVQATDHGHHSGSSKVSERNTAARCLSIMRRCGSTTAAQ